MTELEAINMMLREIGSSPIVKLDKPHSDARAAKVILDRVRRNLQKRGWWFNIDYGVEFQPDPNTKEIILNDSVSTLIIGDYPQYVKRGNKLYNNSDNTYQFEGNVYVDTMYSVLEWDLLPQTPREYIAFLATAQFVRSEVEDRTKEESLKQDAAMVMIDLKAEDLEQLPVNVYDNSRIARARGGVRPYKRGFRLGDV